MNTAINKDTPRTMDTPRGNHFTKSINCPFIVINNGKKVIEIANVALNIDEKNSFADIEAACMHDYTKNDTN